MGIVHYTGSLKMQKFLSSFDPFRKSQAMSSGYPLVNSHSYGKNPHLYFLDTEVNQRTKFP